MTQTTKKVGHYILVVGDGVYRVPVRLIGFINQEECNAVTNLEEAARKLSTAEGIEIEKGYALGKRFVIVIKTPSKAFGNKESPAIWISPEVTSMSYMQQSKSLVCVDKGVELRFKFEEVCEKVK